jgi:hypothetical protein
MDFPPDSPQARAIAHVEARSSGEPVDPTLRVTINFHPDWLPEGQSIISSRRADLFSTVCAESFVG